MTTAVTQQEIRPGLNYRAEGDTETVSWTNQELPKDRFLIGVFIAGLCITLPAALFLTTMMFRDLYYLRTWDDVNGLESGIALVIVMVFWLLVAFGVYRLAHSTWTESIQVRGDELRLQYHGFLAPRDVVIPDRGLWKVSFEKYSNQREEESHLTLNLFYADQRQQVGYWLKEEETFQIFDLLTRILNRRGWSIQVEADL